MIKEMMATPARVVHNGLPAYSTVTPDSQVAGYPRPFATARQDDYSRVGGVPPPEMGPEAADVLATGPGTPTGSVAPEAAAAARAHRRSGAHLSLLRS